jgi:hypothetical protein
MAKTVDVSHPIVIVEAASNSNEVHFSDERDAEPYMLRQRTEEETVE